MGSRPRNVGLISWRVGSVTGRSLRLGRGRCRRAGDRSARHLRPARGPPVASRTLWLTFHYSPRCRLMTPKWTF